MPSFHRKSCAITSHCRKRSRMEDFIGVRRFPKRDEVQVVLCKELLFAHGRLLRVKPCSLFQIDNPANNRPKRAKQNAAQRDDDYQAPQGSAGCTS